MANTNVMKNTLQNLSLSCFEWREQENCQALAELIAQGLKLFKVDVSGDDNGDEIKVNVTDSQVTITNKYRGEMGSAERVSQQRIFIDYMGY